MSRATTRLLLPLLLAGCGATMADGPFAEHVDGEDEAAIEGVTCPAGTTAEVCSGAGSVFTSLYRVGRDDTRLAEVAQTFTVSRSGHPGRATLKLRLPRDLAQGAHPNVVVSLRALSGSVLPTDASSDLASASVDAASLPRGLPVAVEFVFAVPDPQHPATLAPGTTYALVVRVEAPTSGVALVGVASHKADVYAGGRTLRRQEVRAAPAPFAGKAFDDSGDGHDLAFALTLGDGLNVDECFLGTDDCDPNATCTDAVPGWTCACPEGWLGDGTSCAPACTTAADCAQGEGCVSGRCAACSLDAHCRSGWACEAGTCLPTSCRQLLLAYGSTTSGTRTISASGPQSVYCDMSDGGWTKVLHYATSAYTPTTGASGNVSTATIGGFAKLSDAAINAIGRTTTRTWRIAGNRTAQRVYLSSSRSYVDTSPSMNLVVTGTAQACESASPCTPTSRTNTLGPIDTLSWGLVGNDCNRYFVDYNSTPGCYPSNGARCFSSGSSCGDHQPVHNLSLWVKE